MLLEQEVPHIEARPTQTYQTIVPKGSLVVRGVAQFVAPVEGWTAIVLVIAVQVIVGLKIISAGRSSVIYAPLVSPQPY